MVKKIIITGQLLTFVFIYSFSQSDTTVCIDFNPYLNQKVRKNIISLGTLAGIEVIPQIEIGYERILKKNKTISANFGGSYYFDFWGSYKSFHYNIAYRLYFSNRKYAQIKVNNNKYYIRKQQKTMLSPKGLYVGPMTYFYFKKRDLVYDNRSIIAGLGGHLGYQFLFFNRISFNGSLQLPLILKGDLYYNNNTLEQEEWSLRPRLMLNLNIGIAF